MATRSKSKQLGDETAARRRETSERRKSMPPPAILKGQIKSRSEVQTLMLDLYQFGKDNRDALIEKVDRCRAYNLISGSVFSLWRAAFLTHTTGEPEHVLDDCVLFLGTVVRDNIINFAQDRDSREWTVGYYLNSSVFRLSVLSRITIFQNQAVLKLYQEYSGNLLEWDDHPTMWNDCFRATEKAFDLLKRQIPASSKG